MVGRANNPPHYFTMDYDYNTWDKEKRAALQAMIDLGILKSIDLDKARWYDSYEYMEMAKPGSFGSVKCYTYDTATKFGSMALLTKEMKQLLNYYHISYNPFSITVNVLKTERPGEIVYKYFSARYEVATRYSPVPNPIYSQYTYDVRRFDRSDVHFKFIPTFFKITTAYKFFKSAEELRKEIDIDIANYNKFMKAAEPYYKDSELFDTLMQQKKEKQDEYLKMKSKYKTEINSIQTKMNELEEKMKTEFERKLSISEDFE